MHGAHTVLYKELASQILPIHIFGMRCKVDLPFVHLQSVTIGWRLCLLPITATSATTLKCIEVFENAVKCKWQLLVIHTDQLLMLTVPQRRASIKMSYGDNKNWAILIRPEDRHSQLIIYCCFQTLRQLVRKCDRKNWHILYANYSPLVMTEMLLPITKAHCSSFRKKLLN